MEQVIEKADEFFLARIADMVETVSKKNYPKFSLFLDERQQMLAKQVLKRLHCQTYHLDGGYEDAKRKMLCVYPDYIEADCVAFPFQYILFNYRKCDSLTHRDFLGSLMGLQIKRETIGDIIVGEGQAVVIACEAVAKYILQHVQKIGRVGVSVSETKHLSVQCKQQFLQMDGTVASLRIDCVAALATQMSRSKTVDLISAGKVSVNYEEITSPSILLKPGDIITIRGFGKYILGEELRETKKGRYHILLHKYI